MDLVNRALNTAQDFLYQLQQNTRQTLSDEQVINLSNALNLIAPGNSAANVARGRDLLSALVKQDVREAHYHLGTLDEAAKNWTGAFEHYEAAAKKGHIYPSELKMPVLSFENCR